MNRDQLQAPDDILSGRLAKRKRLLAFVSLWEEVKGELTQPGIRTDDEFLDIGGNKWEEWI
mgnify:CR=1 FL=1